MTDPISAEQPERGLYKIRLRGGGMWVPVLIWYGQPADPVTGELMDRSLRWQAKIYGGDYIELDRVWPACAKYPIDEAEAQYLKSLRQWGADNGHAAMADPTKKLDPLATPVML